jgi:hypothetical protein
MVAFPALLEGIEERSKLWRRSVKRIYHDRQAEFGSTLRHWHELFSHASPKPLIWPFEEKRVFRKVFGSEFVLTDARDDVGIQVIDTILWLFKKITDGNSLPPDCIKLMRFVFRRAQLSDFSYDSVSRGLGEFLSELEGAEISEEQIEAGEKLLRLAEERRQTNLLKYAEEKLAVMDVQLTERGRGA